MTEREARIAFNLIPGIGSVKVDALARDAGGSAAEAYSMFPDRRDWEGNEPNWQRELELAEKMHVSIVTELDVEYPPQLRTIASPPLALYVVGKVEKLSKPGVALVGTRHCTEYGRDTAERFAAGLANAGWMVFSGLAAGIDAAAHRGALMAPGGLTAGVLGGALDRFFPPENRDLAHRMIEAGGCVASEFPFGRGPDQQTFPQRNRIVSGLARGVVAVECPLKSGTMITCNRANEQGRAVMAVPGRVDWKCAQGCLRLIREGARMVTCVDDIIEELTPLGELGRIAPAASAAASKANSGRTKPKAASAPVLPIPEVSISTEEAAVLRAVPGDGAPIDSVARAAQLPISRVNAVLVQLRLKGRIQFLPGNRVAPKG